ncbi:MAG: hypothetical protein RLZZ347_279 [Candidatus Parcubacteria bacterium]|jgi:hypothetical protein
MNVEFNDSGMGGGYTGGSYGQPQFTPQGVGMAGWLMKKGIVKDQQGADTMLLGVAIAFFVLTLITIFW